MKYRILSVLLAAALAFACSSGNQESQSESDTAVKNGMTEMAGLAKAEISVPTIQCKSCVANITEGLKEVDGVHEINVDLEKKIAFVSYDASKTNLDALEMAIAMEGYDANDTKRDMDAYHDLDKCCQIPEDGGGH